MKIGIGLPATIPGIGADRVLESARKADAGPFSSLGIIDRLVYPNYEPLITLASVAAVTQRARLMTTILVGPLKNAGILAKQGLYARLYNEQFDGGRVECRCEDGIVMSSGKVICREDGVLATAGT